MKKETTTPPTKQPKMAYKVSTNLADNDYFTDDEQDAKNKFQTYIADYGDGIRLYEGEVPKDDTDPVDWEIIDSYDEDDFEEEPPTKQSYVITENLEDHVGYNGEPVTKVKELPENYFVVRNEQGKEWQVGEEEIKPFEPKQSYVEPVKYYWRKSTSVYNPHFTIENEDGETVANIYIDTFKSNEVAEHLTKQIISLLKKQV